MDPNQPLTLQMDLNSASQSSGPMTPQTPIGSFAFSPEGAAALQKRRSSTRSIKRKKFDDELVESSLLKSDCRGRFKPGFPLVPSSASGASITPPVIETNIPTVTQSTSEPVEPVTPTLTVPDSKSLPEKKKVSKSSKSSKRSKKNKPPAAASTKDLGRWKPQDDLSLIDAVQQTRDLSAVYLGVKFSCKFSLKEIQERWYALLYDPILSKLGMQAIKQMHPDVVLSVQSKSLYNKEEEALMGTITSTSQPKVDVFHDLLARNPNTFHPGRMPKGLYNHWLLMKQYHLLPDQSVQPMPRGDHVLNFSDAEDMINDDDLKEARDDITEQGLVALVIRAKCQLLFSELCVGDRRMKREIRHLEQELPKWQVLVDSVTGISAPDFDNQTLAVLRGRLVRYLMRSREITIGRSTKDNQIDVDLSLEGPAWKISRRQGLIKLKNNRDFYIANEGKRPMYVDGKAVVSGCKQKLNNNSVVEISCLRFIFLINQDILNVIRKESEKFS